MARALNWEKAKRDAQRGTRWRSENGPKPRKRPDKPPSAKQIAYLGSLAKQLGKRPPKPSTSRAASSLIEQYQQNLAVRRRREK